MYNFFYVYKLSHNAGPIQKEICLNITHIPSESLWKNPYHLQYDLEKSPNYLSFPGRVHGIWPPHFLALTSSITKHHSRYSSNSPRWFLLWSSTLLFLLSGCSLDVFHLSSVQVPSQTVTFSRVLALTFPVLPPNSHASHSLPHHPLLFS